MIKAIKSASSAIAAIFEGVEEYAAAFKSTGTLARAETQKLIDEAQGTVDKPIVNFTGFNSSS